MSDAALLFDLPAPQGRLPRDIQRSAKISDCTQYRWEARRWWRAGPFVCWIMLNPSTADGKVDDPTMREVIYFTNLWGYGGLVVVNLYPFRTPNVAACRKWAAWDADGRGPDWYARDRMHDNLHIVAAQAQAADLVVAAWGQSAWDDDWIDHVIEEVQSTEPFPDLYCLGKTASGAPTHPMARGRHRIPRDQQPVVWRDAAEHRAAAELLR